MKLNEICEVYSGYALKSFNDEEDGFPVIKIGNILIDGTLNLDECQYTTDSVNEKYYSNKGDIYIALSGATTGKIGIMDADERYVVNQRVGIVRKKSDKIPQEYIKYFLLRQTDRILQEAAGCAQPNISPKQIAEYSVPEISKDKMFEVCSVLDKTKRIIHMRKTELTALDNLIKARFVELFGSIYDGKFEMKTLPEIVIDNKNSIKRGPFGGALKKDDFVDEGYLVYEQRHAIHNDFEYAKYYITQEKYDDMIGFKVIPGDLIISCSGVTLGRIAEIPEGAREGIINQALLKISLNPEVMLNTFFIQQFRGDEIQEILFGFSRGSGIPNMPSMGEVKAVKFICPPLELQRQYCDFVKQVDKLKLLSLILRIHIPYFCSKCYD